MKRSLPIIYSAHHASHSFGKYTKHVNLTKEQRIRFSDYGSAQTVPGNGYNTFIAKYSRGLVDLNRSPNGHSLFPKSDFTNPQNSIWKDKFCPNKEEKNEILKKIYLPYHQKIADSIKKINNLCYVVAWDNTADYFIGKDTLGNRRKMPSFILSNGGDENKTGSEQKTTTCNPNFLTEFAYQFKKTLRKNNLPNDIYFNLIFKGGHIVQKYNTRINKNLKVNFPVESFQVEYNTALTHNQDTLESNSLSIESIKKSFEEAIEKTI